MLILLPETYHFSPVAKVPTVLRFFLIVKPLLTTTDREFTLSVRD